VAIADFATIGVYGFDLEGFLRALDEAGIDVVVDVRQRRGVRGSEYAWANSRRLQEALGSAGIGYRHMRELAPTSEMRRLQYREDARLGRGQRSREVLADEFSRRYEGEVLDQADLGPLAELAREARPVLLCVERDAGACHRSLVARRLERDWGLTVSHLAP
jgi:uncharacterized protein (DUF488 family)